MFKLSLFDKTIFDQTQTKERLFADFMEWHSNISETWEHTTGRPTLSCTKEQLHGEFLTASALPTNTSAVVQASLLLYTPESCKSYAADFILNG